MSFNLLRILFINLELLEKSVAIANIQIKFVVPVLSFPEADRLFQVWVYTHCSTHLRPRTGLLTN